MTRCERRGILRVIGQFSEDINEEMTFELPFSFPASKIKCRIYYAEANTDAEMTCKMQKVRKYLTFKDFVIEPRLIKKKSMEMLYIQKQKYSLGTESKCESYNDIKARLAQKRRSADFTFIQTGLVRESNEFNKQYTGSFFLALTLKNYEVSFQISTSFEISYTYESRRRRNLQRALATKEKDAIISCTRKLIGGFPFSPNSTFDE